VNAPGWQGDLIIGVRSTSKQADALRAAVSQLTPVWPNLPGPENFLPVVVVLAAILPAAMTWLFGSLNPGQAAWGIRGLDVLEGDFLLTKSTDSSAPPFFAWCLATVLAIDLGDPFWRLTIPSYLFWVLSAVVIHRLVTVWHDNTTALLTILALSINPVVIGTIQSGLPGTVALFWGSLAILSYVEHMQSKAKLLSPWTFVGGISIGLTILTVGLFSLWVPAMVAIHIAYDRIQNARDRRTGFEKLIEDTSLRAGLVGMGIGTLIASPWMIIAQTSAGAVALLTTAGLTNERFGFEAPALVMPTMLALGLFSIARALRQRFRRQADKQASLPVLWSVVAYLVFLLVEPTSTGLLFVVVPLTILAMRSLQLVVNRKLRDRTSLWLVLASILVFMFAGTPGTTRSLLDILQRGWNSLVQRAAPESLGNLGFDLLRVHLALDAFLIAGFAVFWLYKQQMHRDRNRRWILGAFTLLVIGLAAVGTLSSKASIGRGSDSWSELDRAIGAINPCGWLAFLGETPPSTELDFVARRQMIAKPRFRVVDVPELDSKLDRQSGKPLVIVSDIGLALPDSIPLTQSGQSVTLGRQYSGDKAKVYAPVGKGEQTPALRPATN
jgi:hypothetical protein